MESPGRMWPDRRPASPGDRGGRCLAASGNGGRGALARAAVGLGADGAGGHGGGAERLVGPALWQAVLGVTALGGPGGDGPGASGRHASDDPGALDVRDFGARGDGRRDDTQALQAGIRAQRARGGSLHLPAGTYLVSAPLIAAAHGAGPCPLVGDCMYAATLRATAPFAYNDLLGYGGMSLARLLVRDLTLDGNYRGIDGGAVAPPSQGAGALASLAPPSGSVRASARPADGDHVFERVRFYRPNGYALHPPSAALLCACLFARCGRPDARVHHSSIAGGGLQDCVVLGCTWVGGAGNLVDLLAAVQGRPSRLRFLGHATHGPNVGGLYGARAGSVLAFNLSANERDVGAGVGYNAGTIAASRRQNIVACNRLSNVHVAGAGLSADLGDLVAHNRAASGWAAAAAPARGASLATAGAGAAGGAWEQWLQERLLPCGGRQASGPGGHGAVHRAVEYIQDNLERPLSPREVAREAGVSARHLCRLLRSETGASLRVHVLQARMQTAAAMLRDTDLPIKTVARRSGYPDVHYFTRVFARTFLRPPAAFRRDPCAAELDGDGPGSAR